MNIRRSGFLTFGLTFDFLPTQREPREFPRLQVITCPQPGPDHQQVGYGKLYTHRNTVTVYDVYHCRNTRDLLGENKLELLNWISSSSITWTRPVRSYIKHIRHIRIISQMYTRTRYGSHKRLVYLSPQSRNQMTLNHHQLKNILAKPIIRHWRARVGKRLGFKKQFLFWCGAWYGPWGYSMTKKSPELLPLPV